MTTQDLIEEILRQNPAVTQQQIQQQLDAERERTGGLLGDETLLRLIAAKAGVMVAQNHFHNSGVMPSNRLTAGLNDVTVAGRLIAVFPVKTFQGEQKSGKFATLMMADNKGVLRVVLWDERAELVERGELKANQAVRLLHCYTKQDRAGKTELHMGKKSQIEINPTTQTECPAVDKFAVKIGALNAASGNVLVCGKVKAVLGKSNFTRTDATEGTVLRLTLADDSGQVTIVVWNEKAEEICNVKPEVRVMLVNARVKDGQKGGLEVHVDSNTAVQVLD